MSIKRIQHWKWQKNVFRILLFSQVLAACSRTIELEHINIEPQLVISGIVSPGDTASLLIQRNYLTTELNPYTIVNGAEALVYHNEQLHGRYTECPGDSGRYAYSGLPFAEGEMYCLEVSAKGFPTATSRITIPEKPMFSIGTHFWYPSDKNYFFSNLMGIDLVLDDPDTQENHYRLSAISGFFAKGSYFNPETRTWRDTIECFKNKAEINSASQVIETIYRNSYSFAQNDITAESNIYRLLFPEVLFFSDRYFNGQKFVLPLEIAIHNLRKEMVLYLSITAISSEYSQLVRSAAAYEKTNQAMFSEPLQLYSNVENGLGYWVAQNPVTIGFLFSEEN